MGMTNPGRPFSKHHLLGPLVTVTESVTSAPVGCKEVSSIPLKMINSEQELGKQILTLIFWTSNFTSMLPKTQQYQVLLALL